MTYYIRNSEMCTGGSNSDAYVVIVMSPIQGFFLHIIIKEYPKKVSHEGRGTSLCRMDIFSGTIWSFFRKWNIFLERIKVGRGVTIYSFLRHFLG